VIPPTAMGSPIPGLTKTVTTPMATSSPTSGPKETVIAPTSNQTTGSSVPDVPLCPTHDPTKWHSLWDTARGCHYDHEHGALPFTSEVAAAFPGFDLRGMLCGVEIGHCVPSGPTEHSHKHGGFKWNVQLKHPEGCAGHEGATIGVDGSVIQYHGFGNYAIELEASVHSVVALLRQCSTGSPNDYGYVYVSQHVSYGEVASPYQGDLLPYPYYSVPAYDPAFGQYLTVGCIGEKLTVKEVTAAITLTRPEPITQTPIGAVNQRAQERDLSTRLCSRFSGDCEILTRCSIGETRATHTHSSGYAVLMALHTSRLDVNTITPPHRCMKFKGQSRLHGIT
jgi:hypothetical protein